MTTTMTASQSQDNVMQLTYDMTEIVREGFGVTELGVTFPASFQQWEGMQVDPDTGEVMG